MDVKDYEKTIYEFNNVTSQMLQTTYEMNNIPLIRFRKFIQSNNIISNIINKKIEGVTCENNLIRSTNGFWLYIDPPIDESEQIKEIYDYLINVTKTKNDLSNIAMRFPYKSKNYTDKIQNYLQQMFKPLADFITNELKKEMIEIDEEYNKGVNLNIGNNYGTNNFAEGDIQSVNTINNAINDRQEIKDMTTKLINILQKSELGSDTKEDIIDDLETISEEVDKKQPKKIRIQKVMDRLKQFSSNIPQKLGNAEIIVTKINSLLKIVKEVIE